MGARQESSKAASGTTSKSGTSASLSAKKFSVPKYDCYCSGNVIKLSSLAGRFAMRSKNIFHFVIKLIFQVPVVYSRVMYFTYRVKLLKFEVQLSIYLDYTKSRLSQS